jgi:hypothetical protein
MFLSLLALEEQPLLSLKEGPSTTDVGRVAAVLFFDFG